MIPQRELMGRGDIPLRVLYSECLFSILEEKVWTVPLPYSSFSPLHLLMNCSAGTYSQLVVDRIETYSSHGFARSHSVPSLLSEKLAWEIQSSINIFLPLENSLKKKLPPMSSLSVISLLVRSSFLF